MKVTITNPGAAPIVLSDELPLFEGFVELERDPRPKAAGHVLLDSYEATGVAQFWAAVKGFGPRGWTTPEDSDHEYEIILGFLQGEPLDIAFTIWERAYIDQGEAPGRASGSTGKFSTYDFPFALDVVIEEKA